MTMTTTKKINLYIWQLRKKYIILNVQNPNRQMVPITSDTDIVQRVANNYFMCSIFARKMYIR
jgi:hypothetical protein